MKIAIDAGHGINTAGKRCLRQYDPKETREWVLNSRVATKVCNIIKEYNTEIIRLDDITGNTDIGLNERVRNANHNNVDIVVSIHHNAGGGTGIETFVYNNSCLNGKAGKLAKLIQDKAVEKTGFRSRGVKLGNFAIIRDTKAPACLIECGFMDNANDTPIILTEDFANKVANGIAQGIIEYCELKKKKVSTVVTPNTDYTVKINTAVLNVRAGAGINYKINTTVRKNEVYTIVEEKKNGSTTWGKLKSGAGWISLSYTKRT